MCVFYFSSCGWEHGRREEGEKLLFVFCFLWTGGGGGSVGEGRREEGEKLMFYGPSSIG